MRMRRKRSQDLSSLHHRLHSGRVLRQGRGGSGLHPTWQDGDRRPRFGRWDGQAFRSYRPWFLPQKPRLKEEIVLATWLHGAFVFSAA